VALSLLAAPAAAEVSVRVVPANAAGPAQVELTARAAPLGEVLDRLARQVGMKVVYEGGGAPRQLVTLSLQGRTPAETVLALLEGQGLNFALQADTTGAGVQTLLVTGTAPSTGTASSSGRSAPAVRRPNVPPPGSGPDAIEAEEEEPVEDEPFDQPAPEPQPGTPEGMPAGLPGQAGPTTQADPTGIPVPGMPVQAPRAPNAQPQGPTSPFPVSPFAPQPQPFMPQPYAPITPVVPGAVPAPGAPGAPQPQQPQQQQEPPAQPPPG
jgi:hypothetical protein